MDRAEQLADYLAGHLDPVEHARVTAALDGDARLRATLEAMQAADEALGQLSTPLPPAGFEKRLRAALASEVAAALDRDGETAGAAPGDVTSVDGGTVDPAGAGGDELAARRDRRGGGMPRWALAVSSAAAALLLLAGGGIVLSGVLGGADDADTIEAQDGMSTLQGGADATQAPEAESALAPDGPRLVMRDRDLDEGTAQELLGDASAFALAERGLEPDAATDLAAPYAQAFGQPPGGQRAEGGDGAPLGDAPSGDADDAGAAQEQPAEEAQESDEAAGEGADGQAPAQAPQPLAAPLRIEGEVSAADQAQVSSCLGELVSGEAGIVPVYAELADFDGDPAILFGFVTEDPGSGRFTRRELWVVDRATCAVRLFAQR